MIESKKSFALGFFLCFGLVCACFSAVVFENTQDARAKANVYIISEKSTGTTVFGQHNVITDIGENLTAAYHWEGIINNIVDYISVGNATAGTGLTQLTSQYERWQGSVSNWVNSGDYAYNVTYTHMFTETQNINCVGLHWASSGDGNLYAVANFAGGAATFNSADNITITWVITFDCN